MANPSLLILAGDGIGPEVMAEVKKIIGWMGAKRGVQFGEARSAANQRGLLPRQGVTAGDDLVQRRTVLALEPLEQRQPILDLLQAARRRVNPRGEVAQGERQVLELCLDGVA